MYCEISQTSQSGRGLGMDQDWICMKGPIKLNTENVVTKKKNIGKPFTRHYANILSLVRPEWKTCWHFRSGRQWDSFQYTIAGRIGGSRSPDYRQIVAVVPHSARYPVRRFVRAHGENVFSRKLTAVWCTTFGVGVAKCLYRRLTMRRPEIKKKKKHVRQNENPRTDHRERLITSPLPHRRC